MKKEKKSVIILAIIVAIVIFALGAVAGIFYQRNKTITDPTIQQAIKFESSAKTLSSKLTQAIPFFGRVEKISGKNEFEEHCAVCHPKGGNTITTAKTLHKQTLESNGIKSVKDIIGKIRNPGPGMTKFDEKILSNKEATAVAKYILATFK